MAYEGGEEQTGLVVGESCMSLVIVLPRQALEMEQKQYQCVGSVLSGLGAWSNP